jgi:hypothetical protein
MDIMTPSYLFSAISLLLMGYNTRYLALTKLIRERCKRECREEENKLNLIIFRKRLEYIKKLQLFSLYSLIFSVISTLLILLKFTFQREAFALSLLLFLVSLYYSIKENFLSTKHI